MIENVYGKMRGGQYDIPSAMVWFYFIIACAIMGVIIGLYYKFIMKRYEA